MHQKFIKLDVSCDRTHLLGIPFLGIYPKEVIIDAYNKSAARILNQYIHTIINWKFKLIKRQLEKCYYNTTILY